MEGFDEAASLRRRGPRPWVGLMRKIRTSLSGEVCRKVRKRSVGEEKERGPAGKTYRGRSVSVRRVCDGVRVAFKRQHPHKVNKKVLSRLPAMRRPRRKVNRHSHGVVGESFDVSFGDVEAVADKHEAETHRDGDAVDGGGVVEVGPGSEELWEEISDKRASVQRREGG